MKKTLIAASIAALSAGFVAAPALAEVAGHAGATLGQPLDSDLDTTLALEAGVAYDHESGAYAGLLFTTYDLLDSDDGEFDQSTIELNLGYAGDINAELGYDVGLTYEQALDTDIDETIEIYFGANYTLDADTSFSAYFTKDLDSDIDVSNLELGAGYTGIEVVDLFGSLTIGLEDDEQLTLELGVGKEIMPQQYVTAAFYMDMDSDADDDGMLEFTYTYSF